MKTISIAKDFSATPGARYDYEGPFPGKDFREKLLLPHIKVAIKNQDKLVIVLDGTAGFGTSFLEEAFGGLIRDNHISYDDIMNTLDYVSIENQDYIDEIKQYLKDAKDQQNKQ